MAWAPPSSSPPILAPTIRILREYERGVVFFLGRFHSVKGPGLVIIIPLVQQMVRVDLRTRVFDVPAQEVISRDNVSVKVNAVVYFRVVDPPRPRCARCSASTSSTQMRAEREKLNVDIQEVLDKQTDAGASRCRTSRSSTWI